jgi:dynein heavy chain
LEDEAAINIISTSKALVKEISRKQAAAAQTEQSIDEARAQYTDAAKEATVLFFATANLVAVDSLYQFSLLWFMDLYRTVTGQVRVLIVFHILKSTMHVLPDTPGFDK